MSFKADKFGRVQDASEYVAVAAGQTTAQISRAGNAKGDYLDRVILIPASTAAGGITLYDGGTAILASAVPKASELVVTVELGITSQTSKGFNITTGSSMAILAVGRFDH